MRDRLFPVEYVALFQNPDDIQVGILDELPGKVRHVGTEFAALVDGMDRGETVLLGGLVVVLAVRGGHVDDAGAVLRRDKRSLDDVERLLADGMIIENPFVLSTGKR